MNESPQDSAKPGAPSAELADWSKHPVFVVGGAVAATILLCIAIYSELIIPNRTERLLREKDDAVRAQQVAQRHAGELRTALERSAAEQSDLEKKIVKLEEQTRSLSRHLFNARLKDVFAPGTAYPNGFALVQIGMTLEELKKSYPASAMKENDGYMTVEFAHSIFERGVYYYDERSSTKKITHIMFGVGFRNSDKYDLLKIFTEHFGKPLSPTDTDHSWSINGVNAFLDDNYGYVVMSPGYRPNSWPIEEEVELRKQLCPEVAKREEDKPCR